MKTKILMVEDESILALNLKKYLTSFNYDVVGVASTGNEAIQMASDYKPELILMDIVLKGDIDGINAANKIKELHDIPILYITAHPEEDIINRAKFTSPYGYIIKPVNKRELKNTVELALYKHSLEMKLKESELKYRTIIETTHEGVSIEFNGKILYVNQRMCDLVGYTKEELVGHDIFKFLSDKQNFNYKKDALKVKNGKKITVTCKIQRKDGSILWTLNKISPLYDSEGNYYANLSMHSDITESKKAEEEKIKKSDALLEKSEKKYRTLFQTMPIGVLYQNKEGEITSANPAAQEILGLDLDELYGRTSLDPRWKSIDEDGSDLLGAEHPAMIALKTGSKIKNFVMGIYDPKKNERRWINVNATPQFKEDEEKPYQVYTTFEDITEQKQVEKNVTKLLEKEMLLTDELKNSNKELQNAIHKLEISNKELEQFAYISSHDLQEPLRMVTIFSQLLEHKYKNRLDKEADEYIDFIVDNAKRMKELIDDLLAFSRLNTEVKLIEKIDIREVINEVISYLKPSIEESKGEITYDSTTIIMGDISQIRQLFQNLISNGIKFHGEKPPIIHISTEDIGKGWKIGVIDNGIGIEPKYHEKIFEVFKRMHTREEYPGTGIGLAICKKIVRKHGGRIWVESEQGQGSSFYFTIPKIEN